MGIRFTYVESFQRKHYIRCPRKESSISFSTYIAFAMLQTGKLPFSFLLQLGQTFRDQIVYKKAEKSHLLILYHIAA